MGTPIEMTEMYYGEVRDAVYSRMLALTKNKIDDSTIIELLVPGVVMEVLANVKAVHRMDGTVWTAKQTFASLVDLNGIDRLPRAGEFLARPIKHYHRLTEEYRNWLLSGAMMACSGEGVGERVIRNMAAESFPPNSIQRVVNEHMEHCQACSATVEVA